MSRSHSRFLAIATVGFCIALGSSVRWRENPATTPEDNLKKSWWAQRHKAILAAAHSHADTQLILIGDSIINNYDKAKAPDENFAPTWDLFYAPRKALNLGFSGDTTANVLWRLDHGEVKGIHPKAAVVLIGTNNSGFKNQTASQTESGIDAVIGDLKKRLPETRILLLGVLPSELSAAKSAVDASVNAYLANRYAEDPAVAYLDISPIFYKEGKLDSAIFYDPRLPQQGKPLHPDTTGQRMMAEAIEPTLAELMGDEPRVPLASMTDIDTALIPVPRLETDSYDWYARHREVLELQKTLDPRVVLIGDSITHFWSGPPVAKRVSGAEAWTFAFQNMPVLNMGFGWDRTQNVLWRLRQGEFVGLHPRWVVINIGTNNLTGTAHARANAPAEIADAIREICRDVRGRAPESRIVVMGIFPRGHNASDRLRAPIWETNRLLAERFSGSDGMAVRFVDIGARFLEPDGSLPATLMPDGTHPNEAGYRIWADALNEAGLKP